jgi:hypothetical protein
VVEDDPRTRDRREAFDGWLEVRRLRYCSDWTHYPAEALWGWVHGEPGEAAATPCNVVSCVIRPPGDPAWRINNRGFVVDPPDVVARRLAQQQRRWAPLAGAAQMAAPRRLPERRKAVPADPRVG